MWGDEAVRHVMHVGMRLSEDGDGIVQRVRRYRRGPRASTATSAVPGSNASTARELGLTSGVGAPIVTEGHVWGAITVLGSGLPLPAGAEDRLEMFAGLVATAIGNTQARASLAALADHQAALLRVAERVARGAAPQEIFATVAAEASQLLDGQRHDPGPLRSGARARRRRELRRAARVGERIQFEPDTLPDRVRRQDRVVRVDDYTGEPDSALATSYGLAAAVAAPISVQAEVWGMLVGTSGERPLPAGTEHRLEPFAELVAAALANSQARAELQALAEEQTALRRIAELTAQEATADAVLNAVAVQASRLAGVEFGMVLRFEPDGASEIVALDGAPTNFQVGMRAPDTGDGSVHRVWRTGRAARIENLGAMSGRWPQMASRHGFSTSAGVPILLEGGLWGALIVAGREPMPAAIESHLADFAELVGTAIAAAQARSALRKLADEQIALRRVAELVARGAALDEVFAAVAEGASKLLGDSLRSWCAMTRGGRCRGRRLQQHRATRAAHSLRRRRRDRRGAPRRPGGARRQFGSRLAGRPATGRRCRPGHGRRPRVGRAHDEHGRAGTPCRRRGPPGPVRRARRRRHRPRREQGQASRPRVRASIATTDETRRRLQRDLHDGAQQRLVHAIISLKLADAAAAGHPAAGLIEEALAHAQRANTELRDLVHGIMPASLTRGGLRAGLESLVADLALARRSPRHGSAPSSTTRADRLLHRRRSPHQRRQTRARHPGNRERTLDGGDLTITVQDDGRGGADPTRGTGLTGLLDRVDASEGELSITSPPGGGTMLRATLAQLSTEAPER